MAQVLTDDQERLLMKVAGLVAFTVAWGRGEQIARNLAGKGLVRRVGVKEVPGLYSHTWARHWTYCATEQGRQEAAARRIKAKRALTPANLLSLTNRLCGSQSNRHHDGY
jgi:hypothetical protein